MNIAIVGYGKMGKIIEQKAKDRNHNVTLKITSKNIELFRQESFKNVDVAIEFTGPSNASSNISRLIEWGVPVVSGSTGWLEDLDDILEKLYSSETAFFYASNFSISVNIFFEINKKLASLMDGKGYQAGIEEIHHIEKKDAPSGTAISLAEGIIQHQKNLTEWVNKSSEVENSLPIISKRIDNVPGTHSVTYNSAFDSIEIKHVAHSRDAFAIGAVFAAEWIIGKMGFFGMNDMLNLSVR